LQGGKTLDIAPRASAILLSLKPSEIHTVSLRFRRHLDTRRLFAIATVLVLLGGQSVAWWLESNAPHAVCAVDGELIEHGSGHEHGKTGPCAHAPAVAARHAEPDLHTCVLGVLSSPSRSSNAASPDGPSVAVVERAPRIPHAAPAAPAVAILRIAPKNSPPQLG
jgi:hypothetical protein